MATSPPRSPPPPPKRDLGGGDDDAGPPDLASVLESAPRPRADLQDVAEDAVTVSTCETAPLGGDQYLASKLVTFETEHVNDELYAKHSNL